MSTEQTVADTAWTAEHRDDAVVFLLAHHPDPSLVGLRRVLNEGDRWVIGRGRSVLGRGVLDDPRVSGEHAVLGRRRNAVLLRDFDSRNGTKVNGQRIVDCQLVPGDMVAIGSAIWALTHEPEERPGPKPSELGMVGISWELQQVAIQVAQVAPRPTTVLVLGEPGVGKELVARAVHDRSGRPGQLLAVNCGAMSDQLLQSELFGHVRGAFSGAGKARQGLVARTHGGTLFLDEIGDASPSLQVSLLRLLENGEYRPVGSDRIEHADVRVVAATNRLGANPEASPLRADLLGRLSQWTIPVPPLRHRREDIPVLAAHFGAQVRGGPVQLDHRLALALCLYDWPGNVRELASFIERLVVQCRGAEKLRLSPEQLQRLGLGRRPGDPIPGISPNADTGPMFHRPSRPLPARSTGRGAAQAPKPQRPSADELRAGLLTCGGNMKELAARLGVGRNTLYRWFAAAGIDPKKVREGGE